LLPPKKIKNNPASDDAGATLRWLIRSIDALLTMTVL
jgi:hypothetical protein